MSSLTNCIASWPTSAPLHCISTFMPSQDYGIGQLDAKMHCSRQESRRLSHDFMRFLAMKLEYLADHQRIILNFINTLWSIIISFQSVCLLLYLVQGEDNNWIWRLFDQKVFLYHLKTMACLATRRNLGCRLLHWVFIALILKLGQVQQPANAAWRSHEI